MTPPPPCPSQINGVDRAGRSPDSGSFASAVFPGLPSDLVAPHPHYSGETVSDFHRTSLLSPADRQGHLPQLAQLLSFLTIPAALQTYPSTHRSRGCGTRAGFLTSPLFFLWYPGFPLIVVVTMGVFVMPPFSPIIMITVMVAAAAAPAPMAHHEKQ